MDKKCPIYRVVTFIGKRWTVLVLCELYKGRKRWKRYSDVKKKLPDMTPKMLSARFKELESEGLIKHKVDARTFPVKSEYALAPMGEDFIKVIMGMKKWGLKWKIKNEYCENVDCKYCKL